MPPPPIAVGIDCEYMHKIAVEVMLLDGEDAIKWVQDRFDEVVKFVAALKADCDIVTDTNTLIRYEPPARATQAGDNFVFDSSKE